MDRVQIVKLVGRAVVVAAAVTIAAVTIAASLLVDDPSNVAVLVICVIIGLAVSLNARFRR